MQQAVLAVQPSGKYKADKILRSELAAKHVRATALAH